MNDAKQTQITYFSMHSLPKCICRAIGRCGNLNGGRGLGSQGFLKRKVLPKYASCSNSPALRRCFFMSCLMYAMKGCLKCFCQCVKSLCKLPIFWQTFGTTVHSFMYKIGLAQALDRREGKQITGFVRIQFKFLSHKTRKQ